MTENNDFDPFSNFHLIADEFGDGQFAIASAVSPTGDTWLWGLDRGQLGYVDEAPVNATDWRCFDAPPEHERLGELPDEVYDRIWNDTPTNELTQPEGTDQ